MVNILMYISCGLIILSIIIYLILILVYRSTIVSKSNGFDVCKDIISEYNSINIIESKGYISFYNIKRKIIKLDSKTYYGKDLSSITLALLEAGMSILDDNKEKSIGLFGRIVSNLKMLYLLPMLSLVFNSMFYSVADSKIGIVLLIVFCFVMFVIIDIKTKIYNWLCDDLKKIKDINKDNRLKIMNFINMIISLDKLILVGETIMIIRFVMIILGFN